MKMSYLIANSYLHNSFLKKYVKHNDVAMEGYFGYGFWV